MYFDLLIEKWDEILENVRTVAEMTTVSYNAWIKPLKVFSLNDNVLTLALSEEQSSKEYINIIENRYSYIIKVVIKTLIEIDDLEIKYILAEEAKELSSKQTISNINLPINNIKKNDVKQRYTFDNFVVGGNNSFAYSVCLAIADNPGNIYNPLFLHSGPGLGKTHLMKSIENYIIENYPEKKVLYITSEAFTNELIEAIRNGNNSSMTNFREKYREIDVLLIDDIQFIIGKESTQEEFFHTFNHLQSLDKAIIISSDKPPKEFKTLDERFKTRFEQGIVADIQTPDYETRMAILKKKEESENCFFENEILDYIASNIDSNIRELEGALNKLIAYSNLNKEKITLEIAEKLLQSIIYPNMPKEITPDIIINTVAEHFNISSDDIYSKKRTDEIAWARHICIYLCYNHIPSMTYQHIGKILGRDHSTISNSIKKVDTERKINQAFESTINAITKKINP